MIKVFRANDKDFTTNGDIVLKPLKAYVHNGDNGDYYLDLETSIDYADYIIQDNIVVADTPQGQQAFRINNPEKTRKRITARCWHVSYDAENYLIADSYVVDKNCNDALNHLNNATEPQSVFVVGSDIPLVDSYRCVRTSLYEAIKVVLERWGGHLVRDNFNLSILNEIGVDNQVTIEYRKNLKEISCQDDWDSVVTKLLPVGKDGILLNALDEKQSIYIVSDTQYDVPYCKTVSFEQDLDQDDYTYEKEYKTALIKDLRKQAEEYIKLHSVPEVAYTLKANLEKITDIGDIVQVRDERLGIDLITNVISFDYDCILGKYKEITFGNFRKNINGLMSSINSSVSKAVNQSKAELSGVAEEIKAVLGNSYVVNSGNSMYVLDDLPKSKAKNVLRISKDGISHSSTGINGVYQNVWDMDCKLHVGDVAADSVTAGGVNVAKFQSEEITYKDMQFIGTVKDDTISFNLPVYKLFSYGQIRHMMASITDMERQLVYDMQELTENSDISVSLTYKGAGMAGISIYRPSGFDGFMYVIDISDMTIYFE